MGPWIYLRFDIQLLRHSQFFMLFLRLDLQIRLSWTVQIMFYHLSRKMSTKLTENLTWSSVLRFDTLRTVVYLKLRLIIFKSIYLLLKCIDFFTVIGHYTAVHHWTQ